jgi:hypothetical protein
VDGALPLGLKVATGERTIRLDPADTVAPTFLETQAASPGATQP